MKTVLAHEFYKMGHQRSSWLAIVALFGLMLYSATPIAYINKNLVAQGFGAGQWTIIIMIALSANFVAMEFRNNTMTTLLYKSPNRQTVFWAKLIVLLGYGVLLLLCGLAFAMILKFLLVKDKFDWALLYHQHSLLNDLLMNFGGIAMYLLFTITLSLMLITIFKSSSVVIISGLAIGFLGATFSALAMQVLPGAASVIAWNPLNMINIITQFSNAGVAKSSGLSCGELVIGNLIYSLLFLIIGLGTFKKRSW